MKTASPEKTKVNALFRDDVVRSSAAGAGGPSTLDLSDPVLVVVDRHHDIFCCGIDIAEKRDECGSTGGEYGACISVLPTNVGSQISFVAARVHASRYS